MNVDHVPVSDLTSREAMIARQEEIRRRQEAAALKLEAARASARAAVVAPPSPPAPPAEPAAEVVEAAEALEEPVPLRPSARKIIATVAERFGVSVCEITGPRRNAALIQARFAAVHAVATERPDLSLPAIGRAFGGRDHTTIINALRKVARDGVPQPDGTTLKANGSVA